MTDGPFWGLRFQATIILNKEIEVMASKKTVMLVSAVQPAQSTSVSGRTSPGAYRWEPVI